MAGSGTPLGRPLAILSVALAFAIARRSVRLECAFRKSVYLSRMGRMEGDVCSGLSDRTEGTGVSVTNRNCRLGGAEADLLAGLRSASELLSA